MLLQAAIPTANAHHSARIERPMGRRNASACKAPRNSQHSNDCSRTGHRPLDLKPPQSLVRKLSTGGSVSFDRPEGGVSAPPQVVKLCWPPSCRRCVRRGGRRGKGGCAVLSGAVLPKDIYEAVAHGRQARARIAPALFPVLPLALCCWLLNKNERPIAGINCCHASVPYFPLLPITADPTILHPLLPRLPLLLQPFPSAGTGPPSLNYGLTHVIRRLH